MSRSRAENLLLFLLTAAAAVGVQKTTEKSAAEPRYMTFGAQNFLLNKDTWLCTLTFGTCGDRAPSALVPRIADTKIIVFWGKNARIHSITVPMILLRLEYIFSKNVRGAPLLTEEGKEKTKKMGNIPWQKQQPTHTNDDSYKYHRTRVRSDSYTIFIITYYERSELLLIDGDRKKSTQKKVCKKIRKNTCAVAVYLRDPSGEW